eukprot:3584832-Rhodomonas_salina.1
MGTSQDRMGTSQDRMDTSRIGWARHRDLKASAEAREHGTAVLRLIARLSILKSHNGRWR